MAKNKYIVVVGCGRLGSLLANNLSADGYQVVVIDRHERMFDGLNVQFSGFTIAGDAAELDTLRQANIEKADMLFACTTEDNVNVMVAQVAREFFEVPHVVARVYDPDLEETYRSFGIETVSPTQLSADVFKQIAQNKAHRVGEARKG